MPFAATLAATPPFDFDRTMRYLHTSPSSIVERVEGRCYLRAVRLEGAPLLLRVSSVGTGEAPRLLVELLGGEATDRQGALTLDLVQRLFDLAAPAEEFYRIAAADPVFAPVALRSRGVRPLLIPEPFEALVWAIIGQQINIRFAAKLKAALVDEYGGTITVDGVAYPRFPEPATLAAADPERLRALQFSRQKIAYAMAIAQAVESGTLGLEAVRALPSDDALAALMRIKGDRPLDGGIPAAARLRPARRLPRGRRRTQACGGPVIRPRTLGDRGRSADHRRGLGTLARLRRSALVVRPATRVHARGPDGRRINGATGVASPLLCPAVKRNRPERAGGISSASTLNRAGSPPRTDATGKPV